MIELANGFRRARISEVGAELKSLSNAATGQEHIWHGDPAWWNGSAPVLFPIIGGLKGGQYTYQGTTYKLPSHGFARGSTFTAVRTSPDAAELRLVSSPATREVYPFDFSLTVSFALTRVGIDVRYTVRNTGSGGMYFSIGSHPAFVVPFAGGVLENYYVLFEREENLERWFLQDGVVTAGRTAEALESSRVLSLTRRSFDDGAMIFKNPGSREFAIANSLGGRQVRVLTDGVPYLGIWAKPGGAPFLCIEPWHGLPDMSDASGDITEKEGIIALSPGDEFITGYRVEIE